MQGIESDEISKPARERQPVDAKLNEKEDKEDYWVIWGQLVNDWTNQYKKNTQYVKVGAIIAVFGFDKSGDLFENRSLAIS